MHGWVYPDLAIYDEAAAKKDAAQGDDKAFYEGKIYSAIYYGKSVLPGAAFKAKLMMEDTDKSPLEISDAAFATV